MDLITRQMIGFSIKTQSDWDSKKQEKDFEGKTLSSPARTLLESRGINP